MAQNPFRRSAAPKPSGHARLVWVAAAQDVPRHKGPRFALSLLTILAGAPILGLGAVTALAAPALAGPACTGQIAGISASAGSGQVAKVNTTFSLPLQAEVVDTGGCPVANADVAFVAPTTGASALFPGGVTTVTVATGANGVATAPTITANQVTGSYSVEASVAIYSTGFQLTNTTIGAVSSVTVSAGSGQSAHVGSPFAAPLQVNVLDAYGDPVAGATVSFAVVTTAGAGATFASGGAAATAETNNSGVATSPVITAGTTAGVFTVTASVSGATSMVTFSLTDLAATPTTLTAGVGTSQSTELGTDFPVPLAVTVTDTDSNPVIGATVVFAAPTTGPSGVFAGWGAVARVLTNSNGVATAPDFSADQRTGGYVVTALVAGIATPATFALVNEPRTGASAPGPNGWYWLVTSTGHVTRSGGAPNYGSVPANKLTSPVVAMAATPGGLGYWLVTSKGSVFPFGDTAKYAATAGLHLTKPIVGIAATPDGKGYWLVSSKGGIFNYGDAKFYGAAGTTHLTKPIVGIAATPDGKGYWLVSSNGGIFNYGDAKFYGTAGTAHLTKPIVGIAATPDGKGYWLVSSNGGIYHYGDATLFGSGLGLSPGPVTALVRTADGAGYWVVSANGTAAGFGDAGAQGSAMNSAKTVVGGAA